MGQQEHGGAPQSPAPVLGLWLAGPRAAALLPWDNTLGPTSQFALDGHTFQHDAQLQHLSSQLFSIKLANIKKQRCWKEEEKGRKFWEMVTSASALNLIHAATTLMQAVKTRVLNVTWMSVWKFIYREKKWKKGSFIGITNYPVTEIFLHYWSFFRELKKQTQSSYL